jgi:hypothetical protein
MDSKQLESVPDGASEPVGVADGVAEEGAEELEPTIVLGRE